METMTPTEACAKWQLDSLDPADLVVRDLEAGEILCRPGDHLKAVYFLVSGRLRIFATAENGKRLLLRFAEPLSLIGDLELRLDEPAATTVQAVTGSRLLVLSRERVETRYASDPAFLKLVIEQLAFKLHSFSQMAVVNLTTPVATRFASYLVSTQSGAERSGELFTENLGEVAEFLGTTYRHLGRVIEDMSQRGLLERKRGKLRLLDPEGLAEMAGDNLYV